MYNKKLLNLVEKFEMDIVGKNQKELLNYLENSWFKRDSQNVCLIEGFSGIGKTLILLS